MPALEKQCAAKATLSRRGLLAAAPAGLLAACEPKMPVTASQTPKLDIDGLRAAVDSIAARVAPGVLGVGLMNLESGQSFLRLDDRPFPMAGVARLPLVAEALAEIETGRLARDEPVRVMEDQLSPGPSPIAAAWPGRQDYAVDELIEATLVGGDSTAADVLAKRIGGPGVVTAWLTSKKVPGIRADSYVRDQLTATYGMPSSRPAWRDARAYAEAFAAVPPERRRAATARFLGDPRDSATPRGMLEFLQMLNRRELLSPDSTGRLLALLARVGGGPRAALPAGATLIHRPGAMFADQGVTPAHNDVGIVTLADRRAYAYAVFLAGAPLDAAGCDRVIADVVSAGMSAAR